MSVEDVRCRFQGFGFMVEGWTYALQRLTIKWLQWLTVKWLQGLGIHVKTHQFSAVDEKPAPEIVTWCGVWGLGFGV